MKTIILAMHGAPPNDFPKPEMAEFFRLHAQLEQGVAPEMDLHALEARYVILEAKLRAWPRHATNDPFFTASQALAQALSQETGYPVIVGFNEFCGPSIDQACDQALAAGGEQVVLITPMMTRGGEHSEQDIPKAINQAKGRHPNVNFIFAWPFEIVEVARFLAKQVQGFV